MMAFCRKAPALLTLLALGLAAGVGGAAAQAVAAPLGQRQPAGHVQPGEAPAEAALPAAEPGPAPRPDGEVLAGGEVLAVIGRGPGALQVTRADFDRAFRLAVGEVLNRQGLPLRADLLQSFAPSRGQFFEQFIHDKQVEYLARQALPDFVYQGPPRIGPHSFAQPQGYADYLTGAGYRDEADYLSEVARQALLDTYRARLRTRFSFSDAAVESFYTLNRQQFVQREEACARHILVAAQAQARDLRGALLAGADFDLLARSQSRDPGSASRGGALGCLAPGETAPAFDAVLFGAVLGVPQVVQTDQGWHVIEVTERHTAGVIPLEQAAPQVRDALARSAAARLLNTQLEHVPTQLFPERLAAPVAETAAR